MLANFIHTAAHWLEWLRLVWLLGALPVGFALLIRDERRLAARRGR